MTEFGRNQMSCLRYLHFDIKKKEDFDRIQAPAGCAGKGRKKETSRS